MTKANESISKVIKEQQQKQNANMNKLMNSLDKVKLRNKNNQTTQQQTPANNQQQASTNNSASQEKNKQ